MKDRTAFWWALNARRNLMFYGFGTNPTEHHDGHSTPVVKVRRKDDFLKMWTESGSVYIVRQSRMKPNIPTGVMLNILLGAEA